MHKLTNKRTLTYFLAFAVPMLLFICMSIITKIYPFGNISIMHYDMEIQYVDYFQLLRNNLLNGNGFEYSFTKSLGGSIIALFGYYLSSPLNLLVVFFSSEKLQLFFYLIAMLKIGLCGLTFSLFINNRFNMKLVFVVFLSIAYSFTQYNVGQISNISWLDGVYMLPLMMLGVWKFISQNKKSLLVFSVFCAILFNWYTAYMNCIFIVIYYLYEKISTTKLIRIKDILVNASKFLLCELTGVLLSSFFFLPVVFGQSSGRSILDEGIFSFSTNGSFLDIFRGFLIGSNYPGINITLFCSIFMLICVTGFFIAKRTEKLEKIISGIFLLVLVFSLLFTPIEHIWCGFKFENSYQYRFLYVVIAGFLVVAARYLSNIEILENSFIKAAIGLIITFLIFDMIEPFAIKKFWFQLFVIAFYAVIVALSKTGKRSRNKILYGIITLVFITEIIINAVLVINVGQTDKNVYENYNLNQKKLVQQIREYDNNKFYRIEQTLNRDFSYDHISFYANESMAYNYSSIQHYSSSYDNTTAEFLHKLGYCKGEIPTFFHDPILPADSLLSLKYLMSETQYSGYQEVEGLKEYNNKTVYKNEYALPLAFETKRDIIDVKYEGNSFEYINNIYSSIVGHRVELFEKIEAGQIIQNDNLYRYTFDKVDGVLYGSFLDGGDFKINVNNTYKTIYRYGWANTNILNFGELSPEYELSLDFQDAQKGEAFTENFYVLDMEAFSQVVDEISKNAVSIYNANDGNIKANYSADSDGYIMLSVPYDKQWRVFVNGQKVETQTGAEALMVVPVKEGKNNIEMTYQTKGKTTGIILSVATFTIIVAVCIISKIVRKGV